MYAGKSDINGGLQASSLIRFCYVSDIHRSEEDGVLSGFCYGFAAQSNRKHQRVLHLPHGSNAALRYVCVGLYE
jgi:hypothetical protein